MEKRLKDYIKYMEEFTQQKLLACSEKQKQKVMKDLLIQIGFFQHERLIHLIVTVVFALLTMMAMLACFLVEGIGMYMLLLLFFILLIPYIRHYYILENGVQRLYYYYDQINSTILGEGEVE